MEYVFTFVSFSLFSFSFLSSQYGFCYIFNKFYCVYCDSLIVLSNQGSDKIRGIMLCSPKSTKVQLKEQFLKMKNLRFLITSNIQSYGCVEHLPNGLILLDWPRFPSSSMPSNFRPKKLVSLNMSDSLIEKPFKQV